MEEQGIRINKFLSEAGVCSRRGGDRQVAEGNVTVDGRRAEVGTRCAGAERLHLRQGGHKGGGDGQFAGAL